MLENIIHNNVTLKYEKRDGLETKICYARGHVKDITSFCGTDYVDILEAKANIKASRVLEVIHLDYNGARLAGDAELASLVSKKYRELQRKLLGKHVSIEYLSDKSITGIITAVYFNGVKYRGNKIGLDYSLRVLGNVVVKYLDKDNITELKILKDNLIEGGLV